MAKCLQLLTGSADAPPDRLAFQLAPLVFWLMAAADGDAKDCSDFLQPGDTCVMTPLHDSGRRGPDFGKGPNQVKRRQAGLAMAMRLVYVHYCFDTIHTRHWRHQAMKNGGPAVWAAMVALAEQVGPALAAVESCLPKDFHGMSCDAIAKGMRAEVEQFPAGAERR